MSGVYRPLESRRFIMTAMGGYWPVIQKLHNGHLGVVTRDADFHIGERGRLVFVTSPDGGESWSHATVICEEGSDNRNPAFGVAADGTLLASFIRQTNYAEGVYMSGEEHAPTALYISRSEDHGATWTTSLANVDGQESWPVASPYGKMLTLPDGVIIMHYYRSSAAYVVRSNDGGRTWVDPVVVAEGTYGEMGLCDLGGGHLLGVMRGSIRGGICQSDSEDGGYTWSEPQLLTGPMERPGDVIKLQDGRLLLTYGRRVAPWGIQGMVSDDDGKTWNGEAKLLLVADSGAGQGYPSNIQTDDGTIVTVYYSSELTIRRHPRPEMLGIHGAAVLYRPEDL